MNADVSIVNNVLTIRLEKVIEINFEELAAINIAGRKEGDLYEEIINVEITEPATKIN